MKIIEDFENVKNLMKINSELKNINIDFNSKYMLKIFAIGYFTGMNTVLELSNKEQDIDVFEDEMTLRLSESIDIMKQI